MQPYIPADQERGDAYRARLGLASVDQARAVDHPFMGSHITGQCLVCEQQQPSPRHGDIHFVERGFFACDPGGVGGVHAPMSQRTIRRQHVSCPSCLVVLAAAEAVRRAGAGVVGGAD